MIQISSCNTFDTFSNSLEDKHYGPNFTKGVYLLSRSHIEDSSRPNLFPTTQDHHFFKIGCSLVQTCKIYIFYPDQGWPGMISLRFPRLQQDKRCWIAYQ